LVFNLSKNNSQNDSPTQFTQLFQLLSQFNARLTNIEARLNQDNPQRPILDEEHIPAEIGKLGGKTLFSTSTGVRKGIVIPFCDVCGKRNDDTLILCYHCGKKVCTRCITKVGATFLCLDCLLEQMPLSKQELKILTAIDRGVRTKSQIAHITKIPKDDVTTVLTNLLVRGLIQKKGISIATKLIITDNGMEAQSAYAPFYNVDSDMAKFYDDLDNTLKAHGN
jgi:hypothetical protein